MTSRRLDLAHVAASTLLGVGLVLRAWQLGGPDLGFDEFYHVFAARSVLEGSGLEVSEGRPYERASLVTFLIAGAFALFGESEATARVPALVFGVALLLVIYLVGRRLFGPAAGLAALALAAVSPELIDISRFARLYSPLSVAYLLACVSAFTGLEAALARPPRRRAALRALLVAAAALAVGVHLHPVALGMGLAAHAYVALVALALAFAGRSRAALPYAAVALGLAVVEAALAASPPVRAAVSATALTPLDWYGDDDAGAATYHYHLAWQYGWLWYLVWPATVVAVLRRPRAGLFLALAFWVPFLLLSAFVATRTPRYVSHLLPLAWLLLGAGLGTAVDAAWRALGSRLAAWLPGAEAARRGVRATLAVAVLAAALLPPLRLSPSVRAAVGRPARTVGALTTGHFAGWRAAAPAVRRHLGPETRVVASVPLASRYYLDRPAVRLLGPGRQRDPWERAGRTVVQDASDLAVLRAAGKVVAILETWRLETPGKVDQGLASALARTCDPIALPRQTALAAYACAPVGAVRTLPAPGP